jgi:hypothetical protein
LLDSCATILSGTKQQIQITTKPAGARDFVDGMECGITPCILDVNRKSSVLYTFKKEGHDDGAVLDNGRFNATVIANILIGGIIGIIVDYSTGAAYKLGEQIFCTLSQNAAYKSAPTTVEDEADNKDQQ